MIRSDSGVSQPGSFDAVAQASVTGGLGGPGGGLQRSPSVRSNRSGRSGSSSGGSTLGGGSGRKVTPLYNLSFHAVMTTVVTDAGTDAKIAKFLKRGVEILGLAILDPTELTSPSSSLVPSPAPSLAPPPPSAAPAPMDPQPSFLNRLKRMSFKPPSLPKPSSLSPTESSSFTTSTGALVVPLFRTPSSEPDSTPSLSVPTTSHPSSSSSKGYSWTVRKWLRRDLLDTKAGQLAAQSPEGPTPEEGTTGTIPTRKIPNVPGHAKSSTVLPNPLLDVSCSGLSVQLRIIRNWSGS
ncbi:hypothetical protein RQP46_002234 [Phenoliferia psychrophenolica]